MPSVLPGRAPDAAIAIRVQREADGLVAGHLYRNRKAPSPELLGAKVVRSELTWLLVRLDKEYTERRPDQRWEDYYARELLRHFSAG